MSADASSDGPNVRAFDALSSYTVSLGGVEAWRSEFTNSIHLDVPVDRVADLIGHSLIESFDFNRLGNPSSNVSVPQIGVAWPYGPLYWPSSWGSYYIAILDTGVVDGFPLAGRVSHVLGACFSATGNQPGWFSICPGGGTEEYGFGVAEPCVNNAACLHGTHVAAVAGSDVNPHRGVAANGFGGGSGTSIIPIQVYSQNGPNIGVFKDDLTKGLQYVLQAGQVGLKVAAANVSIWFGATPVTASCNLDPIASTVTALMNAKVATVISGGNVQDAFGNYFTTTGPGTNPAEFSGVMNPACVTNSVSVGATHDGTDQVAVNIATGTGTFFSSTSHAMLDFWAPGSTITTGTVPGGTIDNFGTSWAAPHVTGILTRLRGRYQSNSVQNLLNKMHSVCPSRTDNRNSVTLTRACWSTAWK